MPDIAVSANNLTKAFGDITAVNDLSFEVTKGELFGLVGPDGAGKTTTIRMLATILPPTSGKATVDGFDVATHQVDIRKRIGYVAQVFNLYPDLSVDENLDFYAGIFHVTGSQRDRLKKELLEFNHLSPFIKRRASQLSGGMQKKLAVSCALMHEPQTIFLDEPTIGVDPVSRQELWDILRQLNQRGVTLIVSTTYMDEADRMDRLLFIDQGRKIAEGTPVDIKAQYGQGSNKLEDAWIALSQEGGEQR